MIDQKTFDKYAKDPAAFRADLLIDVNGTPGKFKDVAADFQLRDFAAIDPAIRRAIGRTKKPAIQRAWWERGRGSGKSQNLAMLSAYTLVFSQFPIDGRVYAADADQAGLIREAVLTLIRLNGWFADILTVQKNRIVVTAAGHPGADGFIEINSSDVGSSYGATPSIVLADEVSHWPEGKGQDLWTSILSSVAKRDSAVLLAAMNAGWEGSWCWKVREAVRVDPAWVFSRQEEPAPWISREKLDEQRRLLPEISFQRLWLSRWSNSGGDALTPEDIERAFDKDLGAMTGSAAERQVWAFYGGVDLGLTRDGSAVVILAFGRHGGPHAGKIRLAHAKLWRPSPAKPKIDLMDVERQINALDLQFNLERLAVDPWQAELLARRLEMDVGRRSRTARLLNWQRPWIEQVQPTGQNLNKIASLVVETFHDGVFRGYEYEPLRRDLLKLRVIEKSYGIRLESPRDNSGHGDVFSAFSLALYLGHAETGKKPVVAGPIRDESTRMSRAMDRIDRENALRQAEYPDLLKGRTDDMELFRNWLRRSGR